MPYDKLVDSTFLDEGLRQISNSIRAKTGGEDELAFPSGMSEAIDSIGGGSGGTGADGKSAYEIAIEHGFEGSEQEWLESLKGTDYVLTDSDKQEIAEQAAQLVEVPEGGGGESSEWELIGEVTSDGSGDAVGIYTPIEMEQYSELYIYGNHLKGGTISTISGSDILAWYNGYNLATTNSSDVQSSLYTNDYSMTVHVINASGLIMSWFSLNTGYTAQILPIRPSHSVRADWSASLIKYIRLHTHNNGAVPAGSTLQVWGRKV